MLLHTSDRRMAPDATMAPSDDMLREPNGVADAPLTLQRAVLDYTARDERFALDKKIYGQYFQLYFQRLMLLAPRLKQAVAAKWPGVKTSPVLDLKEGEECVIMGTLYKDMKLKPSILDEYVKEAGAKASDVAGKKFVSDDDSLVLEDEGARVKLTGKGVAVDCFVTGVVLAVKGRVVANGEFEVDEICYPAPAPQTTRPSPPATSPGTHVLLCSGLRAGDDAASSALNLELMCDYVTGNLGGANEQGVAASVARVVVCGGALSAPEVPAQSLDGRQQAAVARPLRELDVLLTTLAASVPVDLMPGDGDPTNQALPQQPLHPCLFPEAKRFSPNTFASCTNPHDFTLGGVDFLGTAGQNVCNLAAYTDVTKNGTGSECIRGGGVGPDGGDGAVAARGAHRAGYPRVLPVQGQGPVLHREVAARVLRGDAAGVWVEEGACWGRGDCLRVGARFFKNRRRRDAQRGHPRVPPGDVRAMIREAKRGLSAIQYK